MSILLFTSNLRSSSKIIQHITHSVRNKSEVIDIDQRISSSLSTIILSFALRFFIFLLLSLSFQQKVLLFPFEKSF